MEKASELMGKVMEKVREMVDVSTVIGEPIKTDDGITMIPVSKVSFGFASGGSEFSGKNQGDNSPFGGAGGAGVKIMPTAFVVIKDGNVRIMNIEVPAKGSVERLIDLAPELIDKATDLLKKDKPTAE